MRTERVLIPTLFFSLLLLLWEYVSTSFPFLALTLPPPSAVLRTLWVNHDRFLFHASITFKEMLWGILIAFAVSFPLAWLMHLKQYARDILHPLFILVQCIPMFTLAPIMVIWFGWSSLSIIIPTALMIFFPLTMNIYQGVKSTPQELIDYFHVHYATPWQLFYKLQLPSALPHIFSGLRIATAVAGIGAIAGEWAGAQDGLGLLMLESRRSADLETSFAALVSLTILGMGMFAFIVFIETCFLERKKQRKTKKAVAAVLICFGLILCSAGAFKTQSNTVTLVLDWLPNPNHVPLYAGINKEIFKKHGINLVIKKVPDPSSPISYVVSGQADLAVYYGPDTIRAIHRDVPIKPVGILIDKPLQGLIYRTGEGIINPIDLNDKIAGYCVDGTNTTFLDTILRINSIKPKMKRNVNFDLVSTLGSKQVDYIYGGFWNVECEYLRGVGIETDCFTLEELGVPVYPELVIIAHSDDPESNGLYLGPLKAALQESIDFTRSYPDEAFAEYLKSNPDKCEKIIAVERRAFDVTLPLFGEQQELDMGQWNTFKEWLLQNGIVN